MDNNPARTGPEGTPSLGGGRPTSVKQLILRAEAACDRDDYAAALLELRGILAQHPDFADVRNRAGFCRAMLGDREGALEEFGHALRVNPRYAEAHLNRGLVLNDLTRFDEARDAFERAGALDRRAEDPFPAELGNRIALAHAGLGDLYMTGGQPAAAATEYGKALEVRPDFVDIRSQLARALLASSNVEGALEQLDRVLEQRPAYIDARLHRGTALRRLRRTDEAVSEWRKCLELDPANRLARAFLVSVEAEHTDGLAPLRAENGASQQ